MISNWTCGKVGEYHLVILTGSLAAVGLLEHGQHRRGIGRSDCGFGGARGRGSLRRRGNSYDSGCRHGSCSQFVARLGSQRRGDGVPACCSRVKGWEVPGRLHASIARTSNKPAKFTLNVCFMIFIIGLFYFLVRPSADAEELQPAFLVTEEFTERIPCTVHPAQ